MKLSTWWDSLTPERRRWLVRAAVAAPVVTAAVVFWAVMDRSAEREAYDDCVDAAKDTLAYPDRFDPEPFEDAQVNARPNGRRVDVDIEATVGRSDASGHWSCDVNDDGWIVGIDAPAMP